MNVWQVRLWSTSAVEIGTYYFGNLADAQNSVRMTWEGDPNEIHELKLGQEDVFVWEYNAAPHYIAVEVRKLSIHLQTSPIHF